MKTKQTITALFWLLPLWGITQQHLQSHAEPLQHRPLAQVGIQVTNIAGDTTTRTSTISNFRLRPDEVRAVIKTGKNIEKIDRASVKQLSELPKDVKTYVLPELYYGKIKDTEQEITYKIIFVDYAPLRYDTTMNLFEGKISFMLIDTNNEESAIKVELTKEEEVRVSYGKENVTLMIKTVNWPPLDVTIKENEPKDSLRVKVITMSNPEGYEKQLMVEPAIFISNNRNSINGFGIQTIPISVMLKGVSKYKPIQVAVQASLGYIKSDTIMLENENIQEITLRSEGMKDIEVKAVSGNYRTSPPIIIKQTFPTLFLILSLIGGIIGIWLLKKKLKLKELLKGAITGFIVCVAWTIGINLTAANFSIPFFNEAAILVAGFLGGWLGIGAVEKISNFLKK